MRSSISLALLSASALFLAFAGDGIGTAARAQSAPVQAEQTPQQSDQSRERSRAEDVKIGRDWKAQGDENNHAGRDATDKEHETVGRDWRAHPDNRDH
jgi:hypothetical protein